MLEADVVVVADGPGNLGTNSRWGVSALAAGNSLNAAHTLGGRPVAALRVSFADERERHRSVSHHSLTILSEVCLVPATVAVPALEEPQRTAVWDALREARLEERHQLVEAAGETALDALDDAGVAVESMGRTPPTTRRSSSREARPGSSPDGWPRGTAGGGRSGRPRGDRTAPPPQAASSSSSSSTITGSGPGATVAGSAPAPASAPGSGSGTPPRARRPPRARATVAARSR